MRGTGAWNPMVSQNAVFLNPFKSTCGFFLPQYSQVHIIPYGLRWTPERDPRCLEITLVCSEGRGKKFT